MLSWQLLFFLALQSQVLIIVWGQESIGCFVQGECTDSLYLIETSTPQGELQCLEYCTGVEGSSHFTYKSGDESVSMAGDFFGKKYSYSMLHLQYCLCLANCVELNTEECDSCSSGDISCFEDECFLPNTR